MEWILAGLLAVVGWLLYSKDRLKDKIWDQAVGHAREQIENDRVDHIEAEADAQAEVDDADARLEELDNEEIPPPDDLDAALEWYRNNRRTRGS